MEYGAVKTNIYNKVEHFYNVDIEVLTNTLTGEQSIGWTPHNSSLSIQWKEEDEDGT